MEFSARTAVPSPRLGSSDGAPSDPAKGVWDHDPFFDYVDRWMSGDVDGGGDTDAFSQDMWATYRDDLPDAGSESR